MEIDEYQYYAISEGSEHMIGPYRRPAAIKSALQTSYGARGNKGKKFTIRRAKTVLDESWSEDWSF